jgi:hypothetical protein
MAARPDFVERQRRCIDGAKILAERLCQPDVRNAGITVLTGGTEVHLVLVDLRNADIDGQQAEDRLAATGITVNRNAVPFDPRPPMVTSGLRIGTPALAARGFQADDFATVADLIAQCLIATRDADTAKLARAVGELVWVTGTGRPVASTTPVTGLPRGKGPPGCRALDRGVQPGDQRSHALCGRQVAVEFHQQRARGIEGKDLPVDALFAAGRVDEFAEQAAVDGGPLLGCGSPRLSTIAWAMWTRLAATRMSQGTPSVLPTCRRNSGISRCRCAGVMAPICSPMRSWLIAYRPATSDA